MTTLFIHKVANCKYRGNKKKNKTKTDCTLNIILTNSYRLHHSSMYMTITWNSLLVFVLLHIYILFFFITIIMVFEECDSIKHVIHCVYLKTLYQLKFMVVHLVNKLSLYAFWVIFSSLPQNESYIKNYQVSFLYLAKAVDSNHQRCEFEYYIQPKRKIEIA